jgi:hypothetical protein
VRPGPATHRAARCAALHVCKSAIHDRAIHDRAYRPPAPLGTSPSPAGTPFGSAGTPPSPVGAPPGALTASARPDGGGIPARQLALNLAGLFRSWQPLARRHGWIVIEAHSVRPATAAALIGRTPATALDATHGYSCQYPVEPEVFAGPPGPAASPAGPIANRAPARSATQLTIDHFEVDAANRGLE